MRTTTRILIGTLFIISCNSQSKTNTLTVKEFTKVFYDSLTKRFPTTKFTISDDSTVEAKNQNYGVRLSVDNAYREYLAEPDSFQNVLSRHLASANALNTIGGKISVDRIVPIIKPKSYLEGINQAAAKMGATKNVEGIYEKYNDQLIIFYAEDTENNIRYLTSSDTDSLSINKDSLRPIAIRNLGRILTNVQRQGDNGIYMLTAGGNYETSLILLNKLLTKETLPVNGDFVIAIPNRDLFLVTGSNDKAGVSKLKEIVKKSYEKGSYQVSEYLYKWNGKIFEKYE
jgi:uncharacterized protein YtpQ (UPF0354 family)